VNVRKLSKHVEAQNSKATESRDLGTPREAVVDVLEDVCPGLHSAVLALTPSGIKREITNCLITTRLTQLWDSDYNPQWPPAPSAAEAEQLALAVTEAKQSRARPKTK
jgi:hypothetical protein